MIYRLTVEGKPIPKARPRMSGYGHAYTPQRTKGRENVIAFAWIQKFGFTKTERPVRLSVKYTFTVPKSWSKARRDEAMQREVPHTGRPDLDNLNKAVLDALNGIAYVDDSQVVVYGNMSKVYGAEDKTEIEVMEL